MVGETLELGQSDLRGCICTRCGGVSCSYGQGSVEVARICGKC